MRVFTAKYHGACDGCGEVIKRGDKLVHDGVTETTSHFECTDGDEPKPAGPVCPRCFVELPTSGVCGTC